jgi:hypothetical protein
MFKIKTKTENIQPEKGNNTQNKPSNNTDATTNAATTTSHYDDIISQQYLEGPRQTIFYCKEHRDIWNINKDGLIKSHIIPFHIEANEMNE